MEYLVTMTTRVPDGTPSELLADVRERESSRSAELATQQTLLRLWRPPLRPGEWRTLGLFAGDDRNELERTLASMPLRIWRTDEVTPLFPHPNDPSAATRVMGSVERTTLPNSMADVGEGQQAASPIPASRNVRRQIEYLVEFEVLIPPGVADEQIERRFHDEAVIARALAGKGHLVRLWRTQSAPDTNRSLGLYRASSREELDDLMGALPLRDWMRIDVTPLAPHPNDPETGTASTLIETQQ